MKSPVDIFMKYTELPTGSGDKRLLKFIYFFAKESFLCKMLCFTSYLYLFDCKKFKYFFGYDYNISLKAFVPSQKVPFEFLY